MRLLILNLILLGFLNLSAQNNQTKTLVNHLEGNKIKRSLEMANNLGVQDKDSIQIKNDLIKAVSSVYNDVFSPTEIIKLLDFYSSPLGKKLIKNQSIISQKVNDVFYEWEMKQQGIEIEDIAIGDIELSDALPVENEISTTNKSKVVIEEEKKIQINSLTQLKEYLKSNKEVINDPIELSKILEIDLLDKPKEN